MDGLNGGERRRVSPLHWVTGVEYDPLSTVTAKSATKICIRAQKDVHHGRASATMGAMNKRELAKAVAVQADVELKTVITVIDGFTDVVTAVVSKGEPVSIPGFAKFVKVNRAGAHGSQPGNGRSHPDQGVQEGAHHAGEGVQGCGPGTRHGTQAGQGCVPDQRRRRRRRGQDRCSGCRQEGSGPSPPRRHRPAKRRPARKAPAKRAPAERTANEDREKVASRPVPESGPACCFGGGQVRWTNRGPGGGSRRGGGCVPNHSPTGPSTEPHPTGCRRTIPPTRRSSSAHAEALRAGVRHLRRLALRADRAHGRLPRPARLLLRFRLPALPLPAVSPEACLPAEVCPYAPELHPAYAERSRHERHLTGSWMVVGI